MPRPTSWRILAATILLLSVYKSVSLAQEAKADKKPGADRRQMGEGVILRVEPVDEEKGSDKDAKKTVGRSPRRVKLVINTAAVWRDYARDQASASAKSDTAKVGKDAEKGKNSVATKGQPETSESTIIAEVGPDTRVLLRYRASTDSSNEGSRTVREAEKKDGSPESSDVKKRPRDEKAPKIGTADLKEGLFVEIETLQGKASQVIVLKPVGGPQTPASEAAPKKD